MLLIKDMKLLRNVSACGMFQRRLQGNNSRSHVTTVTNAPYLLNQLTFLCRVSIV